MKKLADLKTGESATVVELSKNSKLSERLADFGLTEGCIVTKLLEAPLGDPILIRLRGSMVAIRRADAKQINIV